MLKCLPKFQLSPLFALNAASIKLRHRQGYFITDILIKYTHKNHWYGRECEIVEQNVAVIEEIGAIEVNVNLIPK